MRCKRGKCKDCKWLAFDIQPEVLLLRVISIKRRKTKEGQCRRYAPILIFSAENRGSIYSAEWPFVRITDWCGRFEKK